MRRLAWLSALPLLLAPAACRQIGELPDPAPPSAAPAPTAPKDTSQPPWLTSEASVFEHIQKTFESVGFPQAKTATLEVSDAVPLPFYQKATHKLFIPPFTDGAQKMRARLANVSVNHFAGALSFIDAFDSAEEAYRGFQALVTVAVAHELAHHVQAMRPSAATLGPESLYDMEAEAIEFEQAYLAHELAAKGVPERWRSDYRLCIFAIRDAIPEYVMSSLPADPKELRTTFMHAYIEYGRGTVAAKTGVNTQITAATQVYAGYTQRRIALLAKGARSLEQLAADEKAR